MANNDVASQPPTGSKGYTQTEIASMQRDAVKRVNEMQRIAKEKLAMQYPYQNRPPDTSYQPIPPKEPQSVSSDTAPSFFPPAFSPSNLNTNSNPQENFFNNGGEKKSGGLLSMFGLSGQNGSLTGILDRLNLDSETLILLGMLLLLVNEGTDSMLILALVYILL